jgi:hypothetical protein
MKTELGLTSFRLIPDYMLPHYDNSESYSLLLDHSTL